eukprot:TRINITY_DN33902_c0_g1_i1.p2 TRINITY_DN33902_c0_g1~~TRINITY_DN33902_c0_g1_i1.p2  ORF type:complete len:117 (-),score=23.14 TRINITY_DN33902_c0_g1_i1:40-390(-)
MGRGVSYGGGHSSLGYLFGSDEPSQPAPRASEKAAQDPPANVIETTSKPPVQTKSQEPTQNVPAGVSGSNANNYFRAEGQNCGNFITDRPSTKVHAAPGGGSSLDYLFSGPPSSNK